MQEYRSFWFSHLLAGFLALGAFNFGFNIGNFSAMQDFMTKYFRWSHKEKLFYVSTISSFLALGGTFGVLVCWAVLKKMTRTQIIYLTDAFFVIGSICTLFANEAAIITGRFINGIGCGLNTIILPVILREIASNDIRGRICGFKEVFIGIGTFFSYVFELGLPEKRHGGYNLHNQWWRVMFGMPIIFSLVRSLSLLLYFKIESPLYLYTHGDEDSATRNLDKLILPSLTDKYLAQLKIEKEKHENEEIVTVTQLFGPSYRFPLILCIVLVGFQQLSGIDAVQFYAEKMFRGEKENMADDRTGRIFSILLGAFKFSSAIFASAIVDRTGRRPLFLIGTMGISIVLLLLAISSAKEIFIMQAILLFAFVVFFSISMGPIVWIFVPETLPDRGVAIVLMVHWVFSFAIVQAYPYMLEGVGESWSFLIFMSCCILCFLVVYKYLPETARKNKEQIYALFSDEK